MGIITNYAIILMMSLGLVIVSSVLYINNLKTDRSFLGKFGMMASLVIYILIFEFLRKKEIIQNLQNDFEYLAFAFILLYFALSWFISFGWYKKDPPG